MIIKSASIITALTVIIVAFKKIYSFIKKIDEKITRFEVNLNDNTLATLRLVINDENMPLDERVIAGDKYVSLGGNGSIHVKYEVLKEQYKGQLKKEGI